MSEEQKELLFDLLTKKAIYGLDKAEEQQLAELDPGTAEMDFRSLEMTAAAISIAGLQTVEPLPIHLREKILESGSSFLSASDVKEAISRPPSHNVAEESERVRGFGTWFGWLGWAAAAVAAVALAFNIWSTRMQPTNEVAGNPPPVETPKAQTSAELREEMLRSSAPLIKATWAAGNVKEIKQVTGDVVWSDEKQAGYIRLRGLAVKTGPEYCYQLWIFDKTQDKETPIDGGVFDVTSDGEIVIPITAKLKVQGPVMFALTIERHGGVVVSKREKIAAIAKVETQTS